MTYSPSAQDPATPEQVLAFTIEYLRQYLADIGHPVELSDAQIQELIVRIGGRVTAYLAEELDRV